MNEFYEDEDYKIDKTVLTNIIQFSYKEFKKCNSGITKSTIIRSIINKIKTEVK
ncbi:MAG: hypothetical protein RSE56_03740 [Bacilli bacterium]